MTHLRALLSSAACLAAFPLASLAAPAANPYARPGPCAVKTLDTEWRDITRDRKVPARIYYPVTNAACPVIVFSHGLGGSRTGYEYLGQHWASHGFVSVHITHMGSDSSLLLEPRPNEALRKAAADVQVAMNRPQDVLFALDQLAAMNTSDATLKGKLDTDNAAVAGHSYGGFTALASAGQTFLTPNGGISKTFLDPRIKAAIAMSPPAPKRKPDVLDKEFKTIVVPFFTMTGTRDDSPIGETTAAERRVPYDHMSACSNNFLVTFQDGNHAVFAMRPREAALNKLYQRQQELILASSTAFWEAFLKNDAAAKDWLTKGGFRELLGKDGTFEQKAAGKTK